MLNWGMFCCLDREKVFFQSNSSSTGHAEILKRINYLYGDRHNAFFRASHIKIIHNAWFRTLSWWENIHLNSLHFIFFVLKSMLATIILEIELNTWKMGEKKKVPSAINIVCHSPEQKQVHLLKMKMCSEQKGAADFYCSNKDLHQIISEILFQHWSAEHSLQDSCRAKCHPRKLPAPYGSQWSFHLITLE